MMFNKIRKTVFGKYEADEKKGLFFSGFDNEGKLLFSKGVVETDKGLSELIEYLYYFMVEKNISNISTLVIDVVLQLFEINKPADILSVSMTNYGIYAKGLNLNEGGVILPNTSEIADVKHALQVIKIKNEIKSKVKIYSFKTDRLILVND